MASYTLGCTWVIMVPSMVASFIKCSCRTFKQNYLSRDPNHTSLEVHPTGLNPVVPKR